jgi:hypothetical protein
LVPASAGGAAWLFAAFGVLAALCAGDGDGFFFFAAMILLLKKVVV